MARPVRRRITDAEVNRELRAPALLGLTREQRLAFAALLRSLGDVEPYRGE